MRKVFIALLATAALLSCNKKEIAPVATESDLDVHFSTNLQTFTVKGETALDGKTVRIFAGAPINATTLATAAENKLTPETPLRWVKNQVGTTTFASIYPAEISETPAFEYDLMYEGAQNFDYHVDVLTATAPDVQPQTTVNLTYKHPFALLQIKLSSEIAQQEGAEAPVVELSGVVAKAAFDLAAGTVELADETAIIPATLKDDLYQVLVMPQTAKPLLTVKMGGKTYKFQVKDDIEFVANKRYSSEITITEAPEVDINYDVDDWEDQPDPVDFDEVKAGDWKVLGLGGDWAWENGVAMTETEGVWEADITYAEGDEFKLYNGETWAGMKANWAYYGLGDFEDGYLDGTDAGINIVLQAAGKYHLAFTASSFKLVITAGEEPQPETVVWKVLGLGDDWTWDNGIAMTCTTAGENPGEGVWEADITYAAGDKFKLCNGTGSTAVWAGMKSNWLYYGTGDFEDGYLDATSSGIDIVIGAEGGVAGEYHLTFTYPSCKFVITGDEQPQPQPEVVLTMYVKTVWANSYLYCWQGESQLLGAWPGTKLTEKETVESVEYFKYEFTNLAVPSTLNYIINNGAGGGSNQTADLTYEVTEKGAKLFVTVDADAAVTVK